MKRKAIYITEKNRIVVASNRTVNGIFDETKEKMTAQEISQIPSRPTFHRRLMLYGFLEFSTSIGHLYKIYNMKFVKPAGK